MNDIEKMLQQNIGNWIGLNYTIGETAEQETVYGILKKVTKETITIEGILVHTINRKSCRIQSIITKVKEPTTE